MKILLAFLFTFIVTLSIQAKDYSVVFYNVENLFDELHDEGKNDYTFLPTKTKGKKEECEKISYHRYRKSCFATDWTKKRVEMKLLQIKRVIDSFKKKPDVLTLCEIENERVVGMLASTLGYKVFKASESPDKRGIDLAILVSPESGLTLVESKNHELKDKYFKKKPTRVIFENTLKTKKGNLFKVYVNHWPSLGNPTETRIVAAKKLKDLMNDDQDKRIPAIGLGDFNTIDENHPHPFRDVLTNKTQIYDVHNLFMKSKTIKRNVKKAFPLGTYFYPPKMAWNRLDRIFVNDAFLNGKLVSQIDTYKIHTPKFITKVFEYRKKRSPLYGSRVVGTPYGYDHTAKSFKKAGFSDHFPIAINFKEN